MGIVCADKQLDSGLLVFKIIEGSFANTGYHLEVVMDDMLFPAYRSNKIKSKTMKFEDIGDAVVRELEFSRVTLRLTKDKDGDEDDIVCKLVGNTMDTLKQALNNPTVLTLAGEDGEISKVKISLKYIPIMMKLDPSESINNMGTLRVDVLDASNLPAADRNGKSDPFCVFELNGEKVHKTEVQKKTLHPAWNEFFECKVPSRTAADFKVSVMDWDFAGDADFLGMSPLDLAVLEPFKPTPVNIKLRGKKGQEGNFGELRLRFVFRPTYVTRSRQGSSTFSGTFAVPGKIVTAVPMKGISLAADGVGTVAGGIFKGASFIKSGFSRKKESVDEEEEAIKEMDEAGKAIAQGGALKTASKSELVAAANSAGEDAPMGASADRHLSAQESPSRRRGSFVGGTSPHRRDKSTSSNYRASMSGGASGGAESGTGRIRLISATGFPTSANVQARIKVAGKSKEIFKTKGIKGGEVNWNEEFVTHCTADQQFIVRVLDDHFIRGDKDLGEAMFVLDDSGRGGEMVLSVGEGKVTIKATFEAGSTGSRGSDAVSTTGGTVRSRKGLFK